MKRSEIKDVLDWGLAYEEDRDWLAPEWEDQYEDQAMAVLQHEALQNCSDKIILNRQCLEQQNLQYFCSETYDEAMSCLDKYLNFKRWEEARRDIIKSKQQVVTDAFGITKAPPAMPEGLKKDAYLAPKAEANAGRVKKWWETRWPGW